MNFPQPFLDSLKFTLRVEGGTSNNKADRGGLTQWGVTQATYNGYCLKKYNQTKPVTEITDDEAKEIYYLNYWIPIGCPNIISAKVALCCFDWAVNSGVAGAAKEIQKIVKTTPDGKIGTATLGAINANINTHGELFVCKLILAARQKFYELIVANRESQKVFLAGWTNRINDLSKVVGV